MFHDMLVCCTGTGSPDLDGCRAPKMKHWPCKAVQDSDKALTMFHDVFVSVVTQCRASCAETL